MKCHVSDFMRPALLPVVRMPLCIMATLARHDVVGWQLSLVDVAAVRTRQCMASAPIVLQVNR